MKIEVQRDFRHGTVQFSTSEIRIVDDALGGYFCRAGWVKDLSGVVPTGNPAPHEHVLMVQDLTLGVETPSLGGV